jgi:lipid-A-disaccharide synthase
MTFSLGLVAGETSGDLLGARVLSGLAKSQAIDVRGIAGDKLIEQGMTPWNRIDELSVRGYAEVIRHLPRLLRLRASLVKQFIAWHPSLFIGVDAPDFNIELERRLKAAGLKTVHFIGPSIWAWRYERIKKIKAAADHVLLVFPFEKAIYDKEGIPSTYVGHPLADVIPLDYIAPDSAPTIALLPGSRFDEISAMALLFLQTATIIAAMNKAVKFVLPAASSAIDAQIQNILKSNPQLAQDLAGRLEVTLGQSHSALQRATTVLVASGTATLEAALFKRPMVIAYKMPWLSYRLMKDKGYLPYIGLPNILANEWLVPEYVQDAATAKTLALALVAQLDNPHQQGQLSTRFMQMHDSLKRDCPAKAAEAILSL